LSKGSSDRRKGENRSNAASAYNLHCNNTHGKLQRKEEAKAKTLHKKKKRKKRKKKHSRNEDNTRRPKRSRERAARVRERERDEGQQAVTRCTSPWQRAIMDDYECSWMIMDDDGCEIGT
jgi:hypothetical protein